MKLISFKTLRSLFIDFIIFLVPVLLLIWAFPYILSILSPFITAFFLYLAANPLNKLLRRNHLNPTLSSLLSLILISSLFFILLRFLFITLVSELSSLAENINFLSTGTFPDVTEKVSGLIEKSSLPNIVKTSSDTFLPTLFNAVRDNLVNFIKSAGTFRIDIIKNIPSMVIWLFTTVFTTFFLLKEEDGIASFSKSFFGEKVCKGFMKIKNSFLSVTFSYIKAQLIIESIIFAVLFTGFLLLKIDFAFLLALITAVVDAVPILGTGTILIPFSLFNFVLGEYSLGWGVLILYGIAMATRQLCEPKILGTKLGVHPLFTVFAMYSGMKLFGIAGLIFGPIAAILIKNLVSPQHEKALL